MARQSGVEFVKEAFRGSDALRQDAPAMPEDEVARTKAYNTYVKPTLQLMSQEPGRGFSERELFQLVADRVKQADFQEFRTALRTFDERRLVELSGRDPTFGDPQYSITRLGVSVTPPD
jgi:hypothetical protein